MEPFFFYIFAIAAVVAALGTIGFASPIYAALSLLGCLFSVACLMAVLGAHFVAAMQVILYAGAIMVLFIFVIMFINLGSGDLEKRRLRFPEVIGVAAGGYLMAFLILRLLGGSLAGRTGLTQSSGTVKEIGRLLFAEYLIPFEATSFLLLVAVIGVIVLAKRKL